MQGGAIAIAGDAGERLGGALPGQMRGMSGGLVTVGGNAGDRAGDRMRRGTIVVRGGAGAGIASRMIAGTVVVLGAAGPWSGLDMKRGTVLLRALPQRMLPTFADAGEHDLGFLRLLVRAAGLEAPLARELAALGTRVRRHVGDAAAGGTGEILVWCA
jgi:formylmethanofuran dehydrogenase subunit C